MSGESAFLDAAIPIALLGLAATLGLAFVRLVRGPSLMDRVVAVELSVGVVAAMIGILAISTDTAALIEVVIAMALVAFLGAVVFARYAERAMRS